MDLPTRKLNLITYLAQLQDENFFLKIEQYILQKQRLEDDATFKPFTVEELINRVAESEQNYNSDKYKMQDDLENTSENW